MRAFLEDESSAQASRAGGANNVDIAPNSRGNNDQAAKNLFVDGATITTHSAQETKDVAASLAKQLKAGDVILLKGSLGAGKTQFTQGLAAGLAIPDAITSPTFNILLEYHSGTLPLYHFDLYRLNSAEELEDIGFYDVVGTDGISVIEWWDKFPECMPDEHISIEITTDPSNPNARTLIFHTSSK